MKIETKLNIIFITLTLILTLISFISIFQIIYYDYHSTEIKFWSFIFFTSISGFLLIFLIGWIVFKIYFPPNTEREMKIAKKSLKKKELLILLLFISGFILEGVSLITYSYLHIFIEFKNIPFLTLLFIYSGLSLQLIGGLFIIIFFVRINKNI